MKKRYALTLTAENMEKMQALMKEYNQPPVMISIFLDEVIAKFLSETVPLLNKFKETGKPPTASDLLLLVAQTLKEAETELQ